MTRKNAKGSFLKNKHKLSESQLGIQKYLFSRKRIDLHLGRGHTTDNILFTTVLL